RVGAAVRHDQVELPVAVEVAPDDAARLETDREGRRDVHDPTQPVRPGDRDDVGWNAGGTRARGHGVVREGVETVGADRQTLGRVRRGGGADPGAERRARGPGAAPRAQLAGGLADDGKVVVVVAVHVPHGDGDRVETADRIGVAHAEVAGAVVLQIRI